MRKLWVLCFCLLATLTGKGICADDKSTPLPLIDDSRFGSYIAGGLGLYAPIDVWKADIERAKKLGIGIVRCNSDNWDLIEPQPGKYTWQGLDAVVQALSDAHIQFLYTLPISSKWNGTGTPLEYNGRKISASHMCTTDLTSVHDFARTLAARYKGRITYYEVWNEPDFDPYWEGKADAKKYFEYLKAAYAGLKEGNPDCVVLMGGLAKPSDPAWLDELLSLGGGQYIDRANIHVYPAFGTLAKALETVRGTFQKYGLQKPIWITETSSTGLYFDTSDRKKEEHKKAVHLVETYAEALSQSDVEKIFWHTLRNPGADVHMKEMDFGLMNNQGDPFPAYQAYIQFRQELLNSRPLGALGIKGLEGYHFDKNGQRILVLWSKQDWVHASFPPEFSKGRLIPLLGDPQDITPEQFSQVKITTEPIYVELSH